MPLVQALGTHGGAHGERTRRVDGDRPEKKNAIDFPMWQGLTDVFREKRTPEFEGR